MTQLFKMYKTGLMSTVFKTNTLLRNPSILNNPAASYVRHRKVYADLGLPEPPKKPANAYLRYLTDSLDGLKLNVEQRKEKYREQAVAWKQLDSTTRDRYQNNFKNEQAKYKVAKAEWDAKITPAQRAQFKEAFANTKAIQTKRSEKRQTVADRIRLGRPSNRNGSSFLIFYKKIHQEQPTNLSKASALWKQLPESEKKKYNEESQKARAKYEQELVAWEQKMLQKGRADLVRKATNRAIDRANKKEETGNTKPKH